MISRRRHLALVGGALAALAGCSGYSTDTTVEEEVSDSRGRMPSEGTRDFQARSLRVPGEEPFVSLGDPPERERRRRQQFVLEDEDATALQFHVDHDDVDSVQSFVEATDYDEASVVIHQRPIDDCYERHVEYVIAQPDRYRVQFCRTLKDATTPCSADETGMEALFIRLPRAYESRPSRRGSGERSRCLGEAPRVEGGEST